MSGTVSKVEIQQLVGSSSYCSGKAIPEDMVSWPRPRLSLQFLHVATYPYITLPVLSDLKSTETPSDVEALAWDVNYE